VIATLYDIHGNLAALEAVLAEVPDEATILVGGDVVAGGPQAAETLDRLRALGDRVRWIRGNGDRELMPGEVGLAYWLLDLERRRTAYPGEEPAAMSREAWLDWVEAHAVGA